MQAKFIPTEPVEDYVVLVADHGTEREVLVVASSPEDAIRRYIGPGEAVEAAPYMTEEEQAEIMASLFRKAVAKDATA